MHSHELIPELRGRLVGGIKVTNLGINLEEKLIPCSVETK